MTTLITITAVYTASHIFAYIYEKIGRKTAANIKALYVGKGKRFRFPNDKKPNESDFNIVQMHKQHQDKFQSVCLHHIHKPFPSKPLFLEFIFQCEYLNIIFSGISFKEMMVANIPGTKLILYNIERKEVQGEIHSLASSTFDNLVLTINLNHLQIII